MIPEKYRLKNTIKYPTSLIIGGLNRLGLEIAESLIEQGGYVILVDSYTKDTEAKLSAFNDHTLISFVDYTAIPHLDEDLRRLDYVFYFQHEADNLSNKISTSEFLTLSNYLDATLNLTKKFNAKFLLTTSIKAHQLVLAKQDLNMEFGYGLNTGRHTVYTEMELQKYAESLVMEYFERDRLDVRIVRLGEIIGDGLDFTKKTAFTEILLDAVTNNQIRLSKDGLDSEWYVHILDVAYGIIKAQFSRVTSGEIYSATYETPFTNLALAYKIQEYDTDAREIVFIDEEDNLPPLKLYKPAPNLSSIGWTPKVPFEKAVKQSLAAAKIYALENGPELEKKGKGQGTLVDKIKGFLAIAESEQAIVEGENSAVGRLIAERKKQEEIRKKSIEAASLSLKERKKRKKTFREKVDDFLWEFFRGLGSTFNIFKNKSPAQILGILALIILFAFVYINYFSPAVAVGRNLLVLHPEISAAENNFKKGDFDALKKNLDTIDFHYEDTKNIILRFQGVANLFALNEQFAELEKNLDAYSTFIDGAQNLSLGLTPFNQYLKSFENNTIQRAATDSYISLSNQGADYSSAFTNLNTNLPYIKNGIDKIQKAANVLESIDYNLIPGFITQNLASTNKALLEFADSTSQMESAEYFNSLFGIDSPKSYVILVLDNTVPTPVGGYISAYALITLNKGSIAEAVVQSTDDTSFKFNSLTDKDLQEINLRQIDVKVKDNLVFNDLANVKDFDTFTGLITKVFKDTYSRDIAAVATINLSSLSSILQFVKDSTGNTLEINSIEFGSGDLLGQLKIAQVGNETLRNRNATIAQLTAFSLGNLVDSFKERPADLLSTLKTNQLAKNIVLSTNGLAYQDFVVTEDFNDVQFKNTNHFVDIAFGVSDPKYLGSDKLPSYTTAFESVIDGEYALTNRLNFKFPNLTSTAIVSLCLPANIADNSITVENLPVERYIKTASDSQKCVNMEVISENQVSISWKTNSVGRIIETENREIQYGISKVRGGNTTLDSKFEVATGLNILSFVPQIGQTGNSLIFTSQLIDNLVVEIVLKK